MAGAQPMNLAVFDIDGTLTQPYGGEDAAFLRGLELAFGFRDVDPDWDRYPHVTDTGIVSSLFQTRIGRAPTTAEITAFQSHYAKAFVARAEPGHGEEIPGAADFLKALRGAADWCIAIATGNCHRMAALKLARGGIPSRDVAMATADDSGSRADLIRLAVRRARACCRARDFGHIVSVGDAPWDLRTAREVGVPFVAVGTRCGHSPNGAHVIPDYLDQAGALRALASAVRW